MSIATDIINNPYLKRFLLLNGIGVLGSTISNAVDEANESEQVFLKLEQRLKSMGYTVGYSFKELDLMSKNLGEHYKVTDEHIKKNMTTLLQYGKVRGKVFERTIGISEDVAQGVIGKDSIEVMNDLGKALQNPIEGIKLLEDGYVSFEDTQKEQIKSFMKSGDLLGAQKVIVAELEESFKGDRSQYLNTFLGRFEGISVGLDSVQESMGRVITESSLVNGAISLVDDSFSNIINSVGEVYVGFKDLENLKGLDQYNIKARDLVQEYDELASSAAYYKNEMDRVPENSPHYIDSQDIYKSKLKELKEVEEKIKKLNGMYLEAFNIPPVQTPKVQQSIQPAVTNPAIAKALEPVTPSPIIDKNAVDVAMQGLETLRAYSLGTTALTAKQLDLQAKNEKAYLEKVLGENIGKEEAIAKVDAYYAEQRVKLKEANAKKEAKRIKDIVESAEQEAFEKTSTDKEKLEAKYKKQRETATKVLNGDDQTRALTAIDKSYEHDKGVLEKRESAKVKEEVDAAYVYWSNYYQQIGDLETAWQIEKARLTEENSKLLESDASGESLNKLLEVKKKEFKKGVEEENIVIDDVELKLNEQKFKEFQANIASGIRYGIEDGIKTGNFGGLVDNISGVLSQHYGDQVSDYFKGGIAGAIGGGITGGLISYGVGKVTDSLFSRGSGPSPEELANNRLEEIHKELERQTKVIELTFGSEGKESELRINTISKELNEANKAVFDNQRILDAVEEIKNLTAGDGEGPNSNDSVVSNIASGGTIATVKSLENQVTDGEFNTLSQKKGDGGSGDLQLSKETLEVIEEFGGTILKFQIATGGGVEASKELQVNQILSNKLQEEMNELVEERNRVTTKNLNSYEEMLLSEDELLKKRLQQAGITHDWIDGLDVSSSIKDSWKAISGELPKSYKELEEVKKLLVMTNETFTNEEMGLVSTIKDRIDAEQELKETSKKNLKDWSYSFKTSDLKLQEQALLYGVTLPNSMTELQNVMRTLSLDTDGLTDAEKSYLDQLKKRVEEQDKWEYGLQTGLQGVESSIDDIFSNIRSQADSLSELAISGQSVIDTYTLDSATSKDTLSFYLGSDLNSGGDLGVFDKALSDFNSMFVDNLFNDVDHTYKELENQYSLLNQLAGDLLTPINNYFASGTQGLDLKNDILDDLLDAQGLINSTSDILKVQVTNAGGGEVAGDATMRRLSEALEYNNIKSNLEAGDYSSIKDNLTKDTFLNGGGFTDSSGRVSEFITIPDIYFKDFLSKETEVSVLDLEKIVNTLQNNTSSSTLENITEYYSLLSNTSADEGKLNEVLDFLFPKLVSSITSSKNSDVSKAYLEVLGRTADGAGYENWKRAYDSGVFKDYDELKLAMAKSALGSEYDKALGANYIVNNVYNEILDRDADSGGLDFWSKELLSNTVSLDELKKSIAVGAFYYEGGPVDGVSATEIAKNRDDAKRWLDLNNYQYYKGGYTGSGFGKRDNSGHKVAGIVHEGEWVAPRWMVENDDFSPILASLEEHRVRGGSATYQTATFSSSVGSNDDVVKAIGKLEDRLAKIEVYTGNTSLGVDDVAVAIERNAVQKVPRASFGGRA